MSNESFSLPTTVKETKPRLFKERITLKRIIFLEAGLSYSTVARKLRDKGISCSRQYIYGIVTGRLTPSWEFARELCLVLGIKNPYTVFDQNELKLPNFQTAEKYSVATKTQKEASSEITSTESPSDSIHAVKNTEEKK